MKFHKFISFFTILIMTVFLLAACGNSTSYITDQRGKSIPVTTSDSNTYTFKLSATPVEDIEEPVVEMLEEVLPEEQEPQAETEEPALEPETVSEEKPAEIGPKTGEP